MTITNLDELPDDEFNVIYKGETHQFDLEEILANEAFQSCMDYLQKIEKEEKEAKEKGEEREENPEEIKMFKQSFSKVFRMNLTTLKALTLLKNLRAHLEATNYIDYMMSLKKNAETRDSGDTSESDEKPPKNLESENEQNTSKLPEESKAATV